MGQTYRIPRLLELVPLRIARRRRFFCDSELVGRGGRPWGTEFFFLLFLSMSCVCLVLLTVLWEMEGGPGHENKTS